MKIKKTLLIVFLGLSIFAYAEEQFVYDSKGRRDPFLPLVSKDGYIINREADVLASDMNLEGIIFDKSGKSLAIINGKVLKVGDKIGNYNILKIEKQKVTLEFNAEEVVLELKEEPSI